MTSDEAAKKYQAVHLGDGAYAATECGNLILTANGHYLSGQETDTVSIDSSDIPALLRYVERIRPDTKLKCVHTFEEVGGVNTNFRHYYSGAFSYIRCAKCGFRERS